MIKTIVFIFIFLALTQQQIYNNDACPCLHGGVCQTTKFHSSCYCPIQYVGKYCQTLGKLLTNKPQYTNIDFKFSHFVFTPQAPNLYKFTFETCMISNPQDLESLVFITSDQEDGSPHYEPSILSSGKIKIKQETCLTFTSPYIEIRKNIQQPFWRIIIGIKAIPKAFKNIFYRTVPGLNYRPIPQEIIDEQPPIQSQSPQRIHFKVAYEVYKETLTESIIRIFIKAIIGAGILLALCLFCRIILFSYGIDTRGLLLILIRSVRNLCRRFCPGRIPSNTYQNYLKLRASGGKEEAEGLRGEQCAICLQPFQNSDLIEETKCKHIYHESCLEAWSLKEQKCPLCRNPLERYNLAWLTFSNNN